MEAPPPDESTPVLHVTFNTSTAATLRQALEAAGRSDRVVGLPDDLSFGPIDPGDAAARIQQWHDFSESEGQRRRLELSELAAFWDHCFALDHRLVAWHSRRAVGEYCGFLEWLWRLGERQADVVDVTELRLTSRRDGRPYLAVATGVLSPTHISENGLLNAARPLVPEDRARDLVLWNRLRSENAPMRGFVDGQLSSVPLSFYDARLLSMAEPIWKKAAWLIGMTMTANEDLAEVGDWLLWTRVRALVASGQLEAMGDLRRLHWTEVRLPMPPATG